MLGMKYKIIEFFVLLERERESVSDCLISINLFYKIDLL